MPNMEFLRTLGKKVAPLTIQSYLEASEVGH